MMYPEMMDLEVNCLVNPVRTLRRFYLRKEERYAIYCKNRKVRHR